MLMPPSYEGFTCFNCKRACIVRVFYIVPDTRLVVKCVFSYAQRIAMITNQSGIVILFSLLQFRCRRKPVLVFQLARFNKLGFVKQWISCQKVKPEFVGQIKGNLSVLQVLQNLRNKLEMLSRHCRHNYLVPIIIKVQKHRNVIVNQVSLSIRLSVLNVVFNSSSFFLCCVLYVPYYILLSTKVNPGLHYFSPFFLIETQSQFAQNLHIPHFTLDASRAVVERQPARRVLPKPLFVPPWIEP